MIAKGKKIINSFNSENLSWTPPPPKEKRERKGTSLNRSSHGVLRKIRSNLAVWPHSQLWKFNHEKEKWPLDINSNHNAVLPMSNSLHQGNSKDFIKMHSIVHKTLLGKMRCENNCLFFASMKNPGTEFHGEPILLNKQSILRKLHNHDSQLQCPQKLIF